MASSASDVFRPDAKLIAETFRLLACFLHNYDFIDSLISSTPIVDCISTFINTCIQMPEFLLRNHTDVYHCLISLSKHETILEISENVQSNLIHALVTVCVEAFVTESIAEYDGYLSSLLLADLTAHYASKSYWNDSFLYESKLDWLLVYDSNDSV